MARPLRLASVARPLARLPLWSQCASPPRAILGRRLPQSGATWSVRCRAVRSSCGAGTWQPS
eukprot:7565286-Alexandrium_andersonii.AAC.1